MRTAVTTAWRRYAGNAVAVWATIFLAYFAARLVIILGGTIFESHDSAVYAPREDPSRNHGPLVSFVGNAPRPWGLPLFYSLFGSDEWRTIGQWALATVAWAVFAWEVSRHLRTRAARLSVVGALLLFACFSEVSSWDLAILTESISISLGLLVLTFLLRWLRTGSRIALAAMTLFAVWWTFVRPDIRVFTVVIIALLAGIVAVAGWRWWRAGRTAPATATASTSATRLASARARTVPAALAALVLIGSLGWYAAITPAMERAFKPYDGGAIKDNPLPLAEELLVFRLRVDVSTDPRMWEAFRTKLGMPTCPEIDAFLTIPEWRDVEWAEAYTRCPALVEWVQARTDQNFWTELAFKDPGLFVAKFVQEVSLNVGGTQYTYVPRVVPAPLEKLAFPSRRHALTVVIVFFATALALALWAGVRRADPSVRRLTWAAVGIFAVAIMSAVATIYVHTGELARYGVQEAYATRVAVILLLACALDTWLARRRGLDQEAQGALATGATREDVD